jgi:hypothetical protein
MTERLKNLQKWFITESLEDLIDVRNRHRFVEKDEIELLDEIIESKVRDEEASSGMKSEGGGTNPEELDGSTCPPAINQVSGVSLDRVVGDLNSTEAHVDMFGPELKPSPAPRWAPDHVPAVPVPAAVGATPIHKDGTQANTFVGEVPILPGVKIHFNNPGRSA